MAISYLTIDLVLAIVCVELFDDSMKYTPDTNSSSKCEDLFAVVEYFPLLLFDYSALFGSYEEVGNIRSDLVQIIAARLVK